MTRRRQIPTRVLRQIHQVHVRDGLFLDKSDVGRAGDVIDQAGQVDGGAGAARVVQALGQGNLLRSVHLGGQRNLLNLAGQWDFLGHFRHRIAQIDDFEAGGVVVLGEVPQQAGVGGRIERGVAGGGVELVVVRLDERGPGDGGLRR